MCTGAFAYVYVCASRAHLVPMKIGKGHPTPWNWAYREL